MGGRDPTLWGSYRPQCIGRELREVQGVRTRWIGTAGRGRLGRQRLFPQPQSPNPASLLVQAWANPIHLEALDAQCKQAEHGWRLAVSLCWPLAACVTSREAQAEVHGLEE